MMRNKKKGQGVVEYAGALVIAAVIVGAVITVAPGQLSAMFQNILTTISTQLTTAVQSANSGGNQTP